MKIDNNNYNVVQDSNMQRVDNSAAQRQEAPQGQDPVSSKRDRVDLSATSQKVDALRDLVNAVPEVRTDRVEALKAAVQNGTYNVSGQQIADKIIDGDYA